jgi:diguanylate cyclase (GGDEF)-like protein/PAS domain S-box-containing protein
MTLSIALLAIAVIYFEMRAAAVDTAEEKAQLILQHNLATHAYLSEQVMPQVRAVTGGELPEDYLGPTWMYSTFAIREINALARASGETGEYDYKEAAINARSPQNEADPAERAFLEALNRDSRLTRQASVRTLDGQPYFELMVRGKTMTADCLECHSTPDRAPDELVARYGSQRGFGRAVGDVVSAVSIRIPLAAAYQSADRVVRRTALILTIIMAFMVVVMRLITTRWMIHPLEKVRVEALRIAAGERPLGEQIPVPAGRELGDLTSAFNRLSISLYRSQNNLEEQIEERTHELRQSQNLVQRALDMAPSALCLFNFRQDRFVYVNQQILKIYGIPAEEFLASRERDVLTIIHPEDLPLYQGMRAALADGKENAETQLRVRPPGSEASAEECRWLKLNAQVIERGDTGQPLLILFAAVDITAAHEAAERLQFTSTHDGLTGLYNWAAFDEALEKMHTSGNFPVSIIIMDVDNLKQINDSEGHTAGDRALRHIGRLLAGVFRADDIVARLGGDEFGALLPGVDEDRARQVIKRLRARLAEGNSKDGVQGDLLSIGVHTAHTPESLRSAKLAADQDMYRDKQRRKVTRG